MLATVSTVLHVINHTKDRARLKVEIGFGAVMVGGHFTREFALTMGVTNIGTRPLTVTQVGGAFAGGRHFAFPSLGSPFPRLLEPGECVSTSSQEMQEFQLFSGIEGGVTSLYAVDSLGEKHRVSSHGVRRVPEQMQEWGEIVRDAG